MAKPSVYGNTGALKDLFLLTQSKGYLEAAWVTLTGQELSLEVDGVLQNSAENPEAAKAAAQQAAA